MREKLIEVFRDTEDWIKTEKALATAADFSVQKTKLYKEGEAITLIENPKYNTEVVVTKCRSFEAAQKLVRRYPKERIAVHNFASATNPGGGVIWGSTAQEECLCRCSTLYPALTQEMLEREYYQFHIDRHDVRYTNACIYTPEVLVIKTDTKIPERMSEKDWYKVDILTCAAPNLSSMPNNLINLSNDELFEIHVSRGRHMLSVAVDNGIGVLVLGAFGCGAFQNNPAVVAQAYKQVLSEFQGYFKKIEFAVYSSALDNQNYTEFSAWLG